MDSDKRYFNFPMGILNDFFKNDDKVLCDIIYYAIYDHALNKLKFGSILNRFIESQDYYGLSLTNNPEAELERGEDLYREYEGQKVKVGIEKKMCLEFLHNEKTHFEKVCLIGYLGLKSILQKQAYCKVTNMYWLSRMNGYSGARETIEELSDPIRALAKEYQLNKLKYELMENWGIINYGRYTRGFYVSSKLNLEDLIYEVEKKRKARKIKEQKEKKNNALTEALERLNGTRDF